MAQTANPANSTGWWERMVAGWQRFISSGFVKAVCALFDFFFNGHFIMAAGKWVALVGARTAVTVLFFASLWVAGESTVHPFMVQIVSLIPFVNTATLDNLALTAFTWLPEIIVLEAILKTVFFWIDVIKAEKRAWSVVWGSIYLPLTGVFVYIAISTFMSYITTHAADTQSATGMLLFRALMAWIYSTIEMAYPAIHRKMYHQEAETYTVLAPVPATPPVDVQALISQALADQAAKQAQQLRELAELQRQAMDNLNVRQEQSNNLQRVEMQRLLAQVQQPKAVASVDPNAVAAIVMQQLEKQIQAMLQQDTTVAQIPDATGQVPGATLLNAPKTQPRNHAARSAKQEAEAPNNITPLPQRSGSTSATGKTALIFALLEKNPDLEIPQLKDLANCDRTTAWRALTKWERLHGIVRDTSEEAVDDATSEDATSEDATPEEVREESAG